MEAPTSFNSCVFFVCTFLLCCAIFLYFLVTYVVLFFWDFVVSWGVACTSVALGLLISFVGVMVVYDRKYVDTQIERFTINFLGMKTVAQIKEMEDTEVLEIVKTKMKRRLSFFEKVNVAVNEEKEIKIKQFANILGHVKRVSLALKGNPDVETAVKQSKGPIGFSGFAGHSSSQASSTVGSDNGDLFSQIVPEGPPLSQPFSSQGSSKDGLF